MMKGCRYCCGIATVAVALSMLSVPVAKAGPRFAANMKHAGMAVYPSDVNSDIPTAHGPNTIITGFEAPFTVGLLDPVAGADGQQGWNSSGGLPFVTIANVNPDTGTQHMRMVDQTTLANGTLAGAFSPNAGALATGPSNFDIRVNISNDGGADYQFIGQSPSEGFVTWRVVLSFSGDVGTEPGTIYVLDNPGTGLAFVNTGVTWTEATYKTLRVEFIPNGQTKYYYDGALIYTDLNSGNNGLGTRVEQLVFLTDNFQEPNETIDLDGVNLVPAVYPTGACCAADGTCTDTTLANCSGNFRGFGTECQFVICTGKCCLPSGFCEDRSQASCAADGGVYSGQGTACNPSTPAECLGRCCLPDGGCIEDGPAPCVASGGTFGGVGVACGDGSNCRGRCCVGVNTCIPDSSPNSCATAGGTLTLGANCQASNDFNFTLATPLAIPDGVGGGGLGAAATNIQNVAGVSGNITDLNVDLNITHSWVGDLVVTIEHLGTSVTVVDGMGRLTINCAGCASNNLDIILDDEGTGGAIEDQCQAANAAATSPPNYTPNNPLTAFDGMNPNGAWTIRVQDACGADTGSLVRWSLHFALPTSPCAPSCTCKGDLNGSGTVNGADINKFAQCVAAGPSIGAGCACADINGSGTITAADVTPFVNALIAGTACIP